MIKTQRLLLLFSLLTGATAQTAGPPTAACGPCIRADEEFLASDALRGRGSGTEDEHIAAAYLGSELRRYGIAPAGDGGGYLQAVGITTRTVVSTPTMTVGPRGQQTEWHHGKEIVVNRIGSDHMVAPLQKLTSHRGSVEKGAAVFIPPAICTGQTCLRSATSLISAGASILMIPLDARMRDQWKTMGERLPPQIVDLGAAPAGGGSVAIVFLGDEAVKALSAAPDNTEINLYAPT